MLAPTASVETLLARALDELRALPEDEARLVLRAATSAFWRATSGSNLVSPVLPPALAGKASFTETVTATDALDVAVSVPELPPPWGRLVAEWGRMPAKDKLTVVVLLVTLANGCVDLVHKLTGSRAVTSIAQQVGPAPMPLPPPSAPKAPQGSGPGGPKVGEPPPLLKRPPPE
jgi:hypothetical protein